MDVILANDGEVHTFGVIVGMTFVSALYVSRMSWHICQGYIRCDRLIVIFENSNT